jgi:Rieske Fe-S protein
MTAPMTRRSVLVGFAVTLAGGVAGYAVARSSGVAHGTPSYGPPAKTQGTKTQGTLLASLSQVPAGGGIVLTAAKIVLTRESSGSVHAFSAVCTHQGCLVNQVSGGTIDCPCHGSRFNAQTGAVVAGPAPSPLPTVPIVVRDGGVYSA